MLAIGLTVAFLASLGAFFSSSKARMTQEAAAGVPVDWQLQLQAGTSVRRRPTRSETWPTRNSAGSTPTAYAAKMTVIVSVEKPSRAW